MAAGKALHNNDKGHSNVHGQKLCAEAKAAKCGAPTDKLVQALCGLAPNYQTEADF